MEEIAATPDESAQAAPHRIPLKVAQAFALVRRLANAYPLWPYWLGLLIAFAVLSIRLAAAGEATLQFWFNSDYLTAAHVYQDAFLEAFPLSGFQFSIAPCLFPDVVFTGVLMFLTRNPILATFAYGLLQFTLLTWAYLLIASLIPHARRHIADATILTIAIALVLYTAAIIKKPYDVLYYLFLDESHVSSFAMALICGFLGIRLCFGPLTFDSHTVRGRRTLATFGLTAILSLLGAASDLMFVAQMLIAFTVTVLVMRFLDLAPVRSSTAAVCTLWAGGIIGIGLERAFVASAPLDAQTGMSADRVTAALNTYLKGFYLNLSTGDWLHVLVVVWLLGCLVLLLVLARRHVVTRTQGGAMPEDLRRLFMVASFLLASATGSVLSIIILGIQGLAEFKDYPWSMHYQYPLFFGAIFGSGLLGSLAIIYLRPDSHAHISKWLPWCVVVIPVVVFVASPAPPIALSDYRPPLVRALDAATPEFGLRFGVGGYWQARWVNLFSKTGLRLYPVTGSLDPFSWLGNKYWYHGYSGSKFPDPVYNFAVLDDPLWHLKRETFVTRFGQPAAEITVANARVLVYNRPSDEKFRRIFQQPPPSSAVDSRVAHIGDRVEVIGSSLPFQVGLTEGTSRVARSGTTKPGYLSTGPYVPLESGDYSVVLTYRAVAPPDADVGTWDIGFFERSPTITLASGRISAGGTNVRAIISVSKSDAGRFLEVRTLYNGSGDLFIERLAIERRR